MIIVPTEKRFDWQHAPVVLFIIVILNSLIYFLYQSTDNEKINSAIQDYNKSGYLEIEWPVYQEYLQNQEQQQKLSDYRELKKTQLGSRQLSSHVLNDIEYYKYIMLNAYDKIDNKVVLEWISLREEIYLLLQSSSAKTFGLIASDFQPLKLISYQFLHGDIMHLIGNMFFLIVCGFAVEAAIGHIKFLLFYLVSGIAASLLHMVVNLDSTVPLIGASGCISAVMAMYIVLFRLKQIEFFYWFFIFVGYFRAPALLILPFYIGKELFDFFYNAETNVAIMAHVGGLISGAALMGVSYHLNKDIFKQESIEEDQNVDPKQEKLASVYDSIEKFKFDSARSKLDKMMNEYGREFDLVILKFYLSKFDCMDKHQEDIVEVFRSKNLNQARIEKIEKIWKENPEEQLLLEAEDYYSIGKAFSNYGKLEHSEKVFARLKRSHFNHKSLSEFALKLSTEFGKINNKEKQKSYLELSEGLK